MKTGEERVKKAVDTFVESTEGASQHLEDLEQQLKNLDKSSTRNTLIIWVVALIIAGIIILVRS
jgi:Flp pilus assembly protein TadB